MRPPYGHSVDSLLEHREKRSFGQSKAKAINHLQKSFSYIYKHFKPSLMFAGELHPKK
jgi:hypothetical protein